MDQSTKQRNYFYSIKKCGDLNCNTCLPLHLSLKAFQKLHHLPNPIPGECNECQYKSFSDVFGKMTTKEHHLSITFAKKKLHRIPFNPLKQIAMNANLIIECTECNKLCIVYTQKKISTGHVPAFKRVTHDLLFVCGSSIEK